MATPPPPPLRVRRATAALAAALAALVCASAAPGAPTGSTGTGGCASSGYAYAGVAGATGVSGVSALLTTVVQPVVESGHVAAWVGVGSTDAGPGGTAQWLQVGVSAVPGVGGILYYELAQPGKPLRFVPVLEDVRPGARHRVEVVELARRPNWWQVRVDGRDVSPPVHLAPTATSRMPTATAETWGGGRRACNRFHFAFDGVRIASRRGGGWRAFPSAHRFHDAGFRLVRRSPTSFQAANAA